jgi:type I restriction enzyme S subunit
MKYGLNDTTIEAMQKVFESNSKIDEVIVFGSRAKGNYKEGSDIDLAVKGRNINLDDILSLSRKLDELNLPYKIDLINYATIKDKDVVEHIDRVGIVFYERWRKIKFSEFVDINPSVSLKSGQEYSFVEMKDLHDGNKFCFPSELRKPSGGARFKEGDTLFARITPCLENGKICQVKGLKNEIGFGSTELLVFRGKQNISDNNFVFYLSRWNEVRDFAEGNFEGTSGRQRVPKDCFENLVLNLPPYKEQISIASILSSLDDKIDLLHRQNKTLEQLAETLFRQWFVEEAEESWEVGKISDFAYINKETLSRNYPFSEIEYLDTGSITTGIITNYQTYQLKDAPSRAQRIIKNDDIVYSLVRPIQRHYGLLHDVNPNALASTGFCVLKSKGVSPYFLYLLLTRDDAVDYFDMIAEGSTSAYPSLKPSDIANYEFQKASEEKLHNFSNFSYDTWNKIKSNTNQIKSLTQLRDALLPKLMSGEIRVSD